MGEIGRDRLEYLFEMSYCDILLIRRGYRRRNILQYQLQRLQAYGIFHCLSGGDKTPQEWLHLYIDDYTFMSDDDDDIPTQDEIEQAVAEINAINSQRRNGG